MHVLPLWKLDGHLGTAMRRARRVEGEGFELELSRTMQQQKNWVANSMNAVSGIAEINHVACRGC